MGWNWDVALAVMGFLIQCGLAWLGLTLNGWKNKAMFAVLVIMGLMLTIFAVNRGVDSAKRMETSLNTIQSNTQKLPPHTRVDYVSVRDMNHMLHWPNDPDVRASKRPSIAIAFQNGGDYGLRYPSDAWRLMLVPANNDEASFEQAYKEFQFAPPSGSIPAHSMQASYHTAVIGPLTSKQAQQLKNGSLWLCGFGSVKWTDDSGNYETYFEQCMQAEPNHQSFNWHNLAHNDEEHKLP